MLRRATSSGVEALKGTSISAILASISTSAIVSGVMLLLFILARMRFRRIYEPRANITKLPEDRRMRSPPRTPWGWILPLYRMFRNPNLVIDRSGMDAYFFMRFLRMIGVIFVPGLVLIWPILLPINAVDGVNDNPAVGQDSVTGLDRLAFGNVNRKHTSRYWAHLIMAYCFVIWICVVSTYEMARFIRLRREWLLSPKHQAKASATTILITSIPKEFLDESKIKSLYQDFPGGVNRVWLNRDYSNLLLEIKSRDAIAHQLELAELSLISTARKNSKKDCSVDRKNSKESLTMDKQPKGKLIDRYVPRNRRPNHRLPLFSWCVSLPNWTFIGKKVDTVDWCKSELSRLNSEIILKQGNRSAYKPMNSAFVQFNRQIAAHIAVQAVSHHHIKSMTPRFLEICPADIIWSNLQLHWWEQYIWNVLVWAFVIIFTGLYAVPVAFIGSLSHVNDLIAVLPWLKFLDTSNKAAKVWIGLVTGALPALLLTILVSLTPLILKAAARMQGHPTRPLVSSATQEFFFFFLFVQVFLVVTISSGVTALIDSVLQNPTEIPQILATNLPKAANFFFSYMTIQGLTVTSIGIAQPWFLFLHYFLRSFTKTARSKWNRDNELRSLTWGTNYPIFSNLAAIGIIYSIIAPLIIIFVLVAFALFAVVHLHNFMYVYDLLTDTGGSAFPKAIQQIFVGVYFLELCLTGLFFLVRNADGNGVPCKGQGIMTVVLFLLTIIFQYLFKKHFDPLVKYLPLDRAWPEAQPPTSQAMSESGTSSKSPTTNDRSSSDLSPVHHAGDCEEPLNAVPPNHDSHEFCVSRAYSHEALQKRQPVIWLPKDSLGLAEEEIRSMPNNVKASSMGAFLDAKGHVRYEKGACPPDYVPPNNACI